MTTRTNSRIAGAAFLAYIAIGLTQMVIGRGTSSGATMAARLTSLAAHATQIRVNARLGLWTGFLSLILGVTLFAITRDIDAELALFGLVCRVVEGLIGVLSLLATRALVWLSTNAGGEPSAESLAALVFGIRGSFPILGALFFAAGSTAFAILLWRGRLVPRALAWIGVLASVVLLPPLALQFVGGLHGPVTQWMWAPMAVFEIWFGLLLILKGVPERASVAPPIAPT
jgi:uncharacterized membrane protein